MQQLSNMETVHERAVHMPDAAFMPGCPSRASAVASRF